MTTQDGVVLRADVYRPDGPGRFPVLPSRLPYDKYGRRRPGDIDVFVEHGYVVIMQDTRGRFASEGGGKGASRVPYVTLTGAKNGVAGRPGIGLRSGERRPQEAKNPL